MDLLDVLKSIFFGITAILVYTHWNEIIQSIMAASAVNSTNPGGRKKKSAKNNSTKVETVIERNVISPNWQSFLMNQDKSEKKVVDNNKSKSVRETPGFWRARRLEKKGVQPVGNGGSEAKNNNSEFHNNNRKDSAPIITNYVGIDCEMVGIGQSGADNMLARVSLVNKFGVCIYDKFVQPREKVVDYRTPVSGVRREDMLNGEPFEEVQKAVAEILKGRVLVGHAVKNDLDVLFLKHPKKKIRDTSRYVPFRKIVKGGTPSLKRLTQELLGVSIQGGEHSSVEDARAAMQLYSTHAKQWEATLARKERCSRPPPQ